ncbi:7-keto-8-aminopelargonate synthetase-like enzyme, partial [Aequitasia blattaphilus]
VYGSYTKIFPKLDFSQNPFHCRQASKSIHLTPYRGRRILDVFVKNETLDALSMDFSFDLWEEYESTSMIRICTSWATTKDQIDSLLEALEARSTLS